MPIGSTSPAGLPVPFARARAAREITRSWEVFLSSGELSGQRPRPLIAERWRACRAQGIDPLLRRAPTVLDREEIGAILARADLGRASRSVLEDFGRVVEGTGYVIVLADEGGRILCTAGHAGLQATLERVNLAPGGLWSEAAVGPNGVGTPLALGRPEAVFGPEHYCQGWQSFFCCGAPIRSPGTGRILGAVDITGPASKADAMAAAFALSIAGCVERNLMVLALERRNVLLKSFRGLERRWPSEPVLLMDPEGQLVDMNGPAAGLLGPSSAAAQGPLAELATALSESARQVSECGGWREQTLILKATGAARGRTVRCRIERVTVDGQALGSVVVMSLRSRGVLPRRSGEDLRTATGAARPRYGFSDILGNAPSLRDAIKLARAVARGPSLKPVLIEGESGTGKEVIAHAIHSESARAHRPLVAVNCGALPRELVESELFGYAAGAFTGARREGQAGKFEAAQGGTIFLDEVDSMPLEVQAKLLRVIETSEVVRLGSTRAIGLDVAIMAASGPDPRRRVEEGSFRLDLFHRLSVVELVMPPLRERREDIPLLAAAFLDRECAELCREPLVVSREAATVLAGYRWPGNVRELQNLCSRWAVTVSGREVRLQDLPAHVRGGTGAGAPDAARGGTLRGREDAIIEHTLIETGGHVAEAARRLGVNKTTIYRWMKRSGRPQGSCSVQ